MATGDLRNNLKNLQTELKLIKYPDTIDIAGLSKGCPAAFLPFYHFAFTSYDADFTKELVEKNIELYGKADFRFMEGIYKVLRDIFNYKPPLSKEQFFSAASFVEQKIIMCTKIIQLVRTRSRKMNNIKQTKMRVGSSLDNITRLATARLPPKPKTAENKDSNVPKNKSNRMSIGGSVRSSQPRSSRAHMRASGSHHSLMLASETSDNWINGTDSQKTNPKQAWIPAVKNTSSNAVVDDTPEDERLAAALNNESQIEMVDIIASTPSKSVQHIDETEVLKAQMETVLKTVDALKHRIEFLEGQTQQPPVCTGCQATRHQLILLQNEVALLKADINIQQQQQQQNDTMPNKSPNYLNKNSTPVVPTDTLQNDSLSGSVISVEGVVNGESKVQRMARQAEAKIRSLSEADSIGKVFSPIKPFEKSCSQMISMASPDCVLMTQSSCEQGRTSTPTSCSKIPRKAMNHNESDIPVDPSTLEKINRIQQMFSETEAMLPKTDNILSKTEVSS